MLLLAQERVGFFKLTSSQFANSTSLCVAQNPDARISYLTYPDKQQNMLFAVSKETNELMIFEVKQQDKSLKCKMRHSFEGPKGLSLKRLDI